MSADPERDGAIEEIDALIGQRPPRAEPAKVENLADFLRRGGKITRCEPAGADALPFHRISQRQTVTAAWNAAKASRRT